MIVPLIEIGKTKGEGCFFRLGIKRAVLVMLHLRFLLDIQVEIIDESGIWDRGHVWRCKFVGLIV